MKIGLKKVRWIKKIVIGLLSFIFLFFLSVFIFSTFYSDNISKIIVNQINKNINASITVSNTKFWLIKYFPNAALTFYNVKIVSPTYNITTSNTSDNSILNVKELSLKFDLIELFKGKYIIQGIIIKDGAFNCNIDKTGKANYEIWQKNENSTKNATLQINKVIVYNLNVHYFDIRNGVDIKSNINRLKISGKIQTDNYDFNLITTLHNISYSKYNEHYKFDEEIKINSSFCIKNSIVHLSNCKLDLFKNKFLLNGEIGVKKPYQYSFTVNSNKLDLSLVVEKFKIELPEKFKIRKAIFNVGAHVSGSISKEDMLIKSNLEFENSSIEYKKNIIDLLKPKLELVINPYRNNFFVSSNDVSGIIGNSKFAISGKYQVGTKSDIDIKGTIDLEYNDISKIYENKHVKLSNGLIKLKFDFKNKEPLQKDGFTNINQFYYSVTVNTDSVNLLYADKYKVEGLKGEFILDNKILRINTLNTSINNNDLNISGYISSPFYSKNDSGIAVNSKLKIYSKKLDLESLYFQNDTSTSNLNLNITINLVAEELKYKLFMANKLSATIRIAPNKIESYGLQFNTLKGSVKDGNFKFLNNKDNSQLESVFKTKNIDLKELFSSYNNFGLKDITSKNLQGKISGSFVYNCSFDKTTNLVPSSIFCKSEIEIKDGAISQINVVNKLFKYLKMNNIDELRFGTIKNTIKIENGIVIIAPIQLTTNAINIEVSGKHNFDNNYEYHFKFNLSDILSKRKKDEPNNDIALITEKDSTRKLNIFVVLKGKGSDYTFAYDNKQAMNSFVTRLQGEKAFIKDLINHELGIKKDTLKIQKKTTPKIINPLQKEDNPKKEKKLTKQQKQQIEWKDE